MVCPRNCESRNWSLILPYLVAAGSEKSGATDPIVGPGRGAGAAAAGGEAGGCCAGPVVGAHASIVDAAANRGSLLRFKRSRMRGLR